MNFTSSFGVPISNAIQQMTQWPTTKLTANLGAANSQVVGILQSGENGVNYLRTLDSNSLPSNSTAVHTTPTVITLPIQLPTDKPGDPPQTVQIQVLPTMPTLSQQSQGTKYQMTQIPVQAVHQGATLLWCTSQSQSSDGTVQLQIADQQSLPENMTVVTTLQPSDIQLIQTSTASHLIKNEMNLKNDQDDQMPVSVIKSEAESPQGMEDDSQNDDMQNSLDWNNQNHQQEHLKHQQQQQQSQEQQQFQQQQQQMQQSHQQDQIQQQEQNLSNDYINLQSFLKFNNTNNSIKQEVVQISDINNENGDNLQITEDTTEALEEVDDGDPKSKRKKKYKKKPPKPKKPKPGQVQIATALDGTTLFCCPECHMAYAEKEMLEQHLVMHKIERRFICDICGAGLKRKEHLERHKMGHSPERPFICNVCSKGFKRKEHLNLHVVIHSGQKTEICGECGKGFYRKDHLRKHVRSHLMRRMKEELNHQNHTFNNVSLASALQQPQVHHLTIQMQTSPLQLPVQIQVPHHQIKMDSNLNDNSDLNQVSTVVLPTAEETSNMAAHLSPNDISDSSSQSQQYANQNQQDQHIENIIVERHSQKQQQNHTNILIDQTQNSPNLNNGSLTNNNNSINKDYNLHE